LKIREEQVEDRRLRFQQKKANLEKLENPPPPIKLEKKGKNKQLLIRSKQESEEVAELPYLPTPDEIIFQREGTILG